MEKCIFIGYPEGFKGWKFYNLEMSFRKGQIQRYTYKGKMLKGGPKFTDPELRPLIPIADEPTSVIPPVETVVENDKDDNNDIYVEELDQEEQSVEPVSTTASTCCAEPGR